MELAAKQHFYERLAEELAALLTGERDLIASAANTAALLFHRLDNVNWAGFYFRQGDQLVLGPFQGHPACVRIALGKGVCGTAASQAKTIVVPDVHAFPGHIACDAASQSEVVVPISFEDHVIGVLDVDSPNLERFDSADARGLERVIGVFCDATDLSAAPACDG